MYKVDWYWSANCGCVWPSYTPYMVNGLLHWSLRIVYCTGFNQERHTGQSLMCFSFQLFVGTKDGHLLMYGVTRKPGGSDHNVQLLRLFCFYFTFKIWKYSFLPFKRVKMSDQVEQILQQESHHAAGGCPWVLNLGGAQRGNGGFWIFDIHRLNIW